MEYIIFMAMYMPEEDVMKELEELSAIVEEGKETEIDKELEEIEKITRETGKEEKGEKKEIEKKGEEKEKVVEKKEEKEKIPVEKEEKKEKEIQKPHEAIKTGIGFKYASVSLIVFGAVIYILAFYLRWSGWRLIAYPPSAIVALVGTLLILAGGEMYYHAKKR